MNAPAPGGSPEFAGTVTAVTRAVVQALAQLEAVLAAQRRELVALAAFGGQPVELPPAPAPAALDVVKDMTEEPGTGGLATAAIHQAAAHALVLALYNTVTAQQQLNVLGQAITAKVAARLLESG